MAGVNAQMPKHIKNKVVLSNEVALVVMFVVALPFVIISAVYFKPLIYIPIAGFVVATGSIVLNYFGFFNVARLVIALLPLALATVYNAYLVPAGTDALTGPFLISFSFTLIPFLIFDPAERAFLLLTTLMSAMAIIGFQWFNRLLEIPIDNTVMATGWLSPFSKCVALLFALTAIFVMAFNNKVNEKRAAKLLEEGAAQNKVLQESQNELEENLEALEESRTEEAKRQWANEGENRMGNLLRQDFTDMNDLYYGIISEVVHYLEVNQGALFTVEATGEGMAAQEHLVMKSCYAYNRKKFIDKRIAKGEGLTGQAWQEADTLYLTEVPQSYVNITSGLGNAAPKAILIVPLKVDDLVVGMIELAAFNELPAHKVKLVQTMSTNIASHLQSQANATRTKVLLQKTQQMTEEMRAQEEEMRQNMEELQATQEDAARRIKAYEELLEANGIDYLEKVG